MSNPYLVKARDAIISCETLEELKNDPLLTKSYPTAFLITEKFDLERHTEILDTLSIKNTDVKNHFIFESKNLKDGTHKFQTMDLFVLSLFISKTNEVAMLLNQANWLYYYMSRAIKHPRKRKTLFEEQIESWEKKKKCLTVSPTCQLYLAQGGFHLNAREEAVDFDGMQLQDFRKYLLNLNKNLASKAAGE